MNLDINKNTILKYLNDFNKAIPTTKFIFARKKHVDTSKLNDNENRIIEFYESGALISPMSIDNKSINLLKENIDLITQFPSELKPDNIFERKILDQTRNSRKSRTILLPSVIESNADLMNKYDKMVSYYLLMGGDKPIERFSRTEMSMKQYGASPDIGISIMKYGNEITTKLEEIAPSKQKSSKEWEFYKDQVLHCFFTAEKIGNRNVNQEEHKIWEDRLIRLGILERRIEKPDNKPDFKETIKLQDNNSGNDNKSPNQQAVSLETAILRNAQELYNNTGMIPIGFKKDNTGKIVRIRTEFPQDKKAQNKTQNKTQNEINNQNKQALLR